MDAFTGQRVEIDRQRGNQRLPLAGLHLGDPSEVQRHPPHQLHVEVPLAEHAPCRLSTRANASTSRSSTALTVFEPLAELDVGEGPQLIVRKSLDLRFEGVDQRNQLGQTTYFLSLAGAEDFREHAHGVITLPSGRVLSLPGRSSAISRLNRDLSPTHGRTEGAPRSDPGGPLVVQAVRTLSPGSTPSWPGGGEDGGDPRAALGLLELVLELVHHQVDGHQRHGAGRVSTNGAPVAEDDHFAALPVGDPRVVFLGEVHFGSIETRAVPEQSAHLLLDQRPYLVGHYPSAVRDDNVHLLASQVVLACIVTGVVGRYSYSVMGWILSVLWMGVRTG